MSLNSFFSIIVLGLISLSASVHGAPTLNYVAAVLEKGQAWVKCPQTQSFVPLALQDPVSELAWVGDHIVVRTSNAKIDSLYEVVDACRGQIQGIASGITSFAIDEIPGSVAFTYGGYLYGQELKGAATAVSTFNPKSGRYNLREGRLAFLENSVLSVATAPYQQLLFQTIAKGVERLRNGADYISFTRTGSQGTELYVASAADEFQPQLVPGSQGHDKYWLTRRSNLAAAVPSLVFLRAGQIFAIDSLNSKTILNPIMLWKGGDAAENVEVSRDSMAFLTHSGQLYYADSFAYPQFVDSAVMSFSMRTDDFGNGFLAFLKNGLLFVSSLTPGGNGGVAPVLIVKGSVSKVVVDKALNVFFLAGGNVFRVTDLQYGSYELTLKGVADLSLIDGVARVQVQGSTASQPIDWHVCGRLLSAG